MFNLSNIGRKLYYPEEPEEIELTELSEAELEAADTQPALQCDSTKAEEVVDKIANEAMSNVATIGKKYDSTKRTERVKSFVYRFLTSESLIYSTVLYWNKKKIATGNTLQYKVLSRSSYLLSGIVSTIGSIAKIPLYLVNAAILETTNCKAKLNTVIANKDNLRRKYQQQAVFKWIAIAVYHTSMQPISVAFHSLKFTLVGTDYLENKDKTQPGIIGKVIEGIKNRTEPVIGSWNELKADWTKNLHLNSLMPKAQRKSLNDEIEMQPKKARLTAQN